jgi:hypothetical protein
MPDFNIRSDSVNVEQIMEQIRARIREKRGVDYTETQLQELAAVKLERFLDPGSVRSDLLEQFRRTAPPPARPNYAFGEDTLFETHRGPIRWMRQLLKPLLKLFFNPNPLIQALHIQSQLNTINAERETARYRLDQLYYELIHNLVVETTRLGIEGKNLKMRVESLSSRLEFNERRARALESVVAYAPGEAAEMPAPVESAVAQFPSPVETQPAMAGPASTTAAPAPATEGPGQRSRRRRRRRGRRGGGSAVSVMTPGGEGQSPHAAGETDAAFEHDAAFEAEPDEASPHVASHHEAPHHEVVHHEAPHSEPPRNDEPPQAEPHPSADAGHGGPDDEL